MELIQKYFNDFTPEQTQQLASLKDLYTEWNEKINVISRKDIDNFYLHHVLHSLTIATKFDLKPGMEILDLGCGGGFPGVPLAIFFPDVQFHLVDSINKKLKVVNEIAAAANINNITTQHSRVEDIKNRQFDTVVSRAVAPLGDLWHWSRKLIRRTSKAEKAVPNGLICLKGGDLTQEIFESNCKPHVWEINKIFEEPYFDEKFMLYQPLK
ncbi:16S rRNA (guanine(527)-N(7))-methyltransferase RsmG [Ferruginibacter yonginensis]|uniref:Ribosomal RNA small subunit methyltransferase G n=1 Tax=Ferruginibacter yonginensis TaxID=1310416 RepID=A0ABV8QQY6_9BACT